MLRTYLILSLAAALPGCFILLALVIVLYALARRIEVQLTIVQNQMAHALELLQAWQRNWGDDIATKQALSAIDARRPTPPKGNHS